MLLTVAICTRDRASSIANTLTSLVECKPPEDASWEVVVVDNGSSDETSSVVAAFESVLPLRVVAEPNRGLAHARNAAVHAARGEYLLWTDDDCIVGHDWLVEYAAAIRRWPDAVLFGGPIKPRFEGTPPAWLMRIAERVGGVFAARDLGSEPIALSVEGDRVPYGANYAIRAREQRSRLYDTRLGRGAELPMKTGEESEVVESMLREGAQGRWVPGAGVIHCVPPERQRVSYLRECFTAGGAYAEWRRHVTPGSVDLSDDPPTYRLVVRAVRSEMRYRLLRLVGQPEAWIDDLLLASFTRGRLRARRLPRRAVI